MPDVNDRAAFDAWARLDVKIRRHRLARYVSAMSNAAARTVFLRDIEKHHGREARKRLQRIGRWWHRTPQATP